MAMIYKIQNWVMPPFGGFHLININVKSEKVLIHEKTKIFFVSTINSKKCSDILL